ncbi:MAG: peptidase [Alphaproteobacteria bacterium]|nr:peptidase [Alphaproteobacteria bacterium]
MKKYIFSLILCSFVSYSAIAINIGLNLGDDLEPDQKDAFKAARSRWGKILINDDLPRENNDGFDIIIDANAITIDGVGKTLGQAAPTRLRPHSYIPTRAIMEFDKADLLNMTSNGSLLNVIMHEMGHALGFGSIWQHLNLIGGDDSNPLFIGNNAVEVYSSWRKSKTLMAVPLENIPRPGTFKSHWKESIFGNELMTGFLDRGPNPLSPLTIAAFEDMGYEVDYGQAEAYSLPPITPVVRSYDSSVLRLSPMPRSSCYCHATTVLPKTYYSKLYSSSVYSPPVYSSSCDYYCMIQ